MLRLTINVTDDLGEQIKGAATQADRSVSSFISEVMKAYLAQQKKGEFLSSTKALIGQGGVSSTCLAELLHMRATDDHRL